MQTFKVGDKAVYPGQGVGEVMGIEHKDIAGQRQSFYVLKIMENGMKILIPINKVGSVGLRSLIDEKAVNKVYTILKQKDISVDSATWNRRYREYMEKIIRRALERGQDPKQFAEHFIEESRRDMQALNVLPADIEPKATEHIPEMLALIGQLIERGNAYPSQEI